MIDRILPPSRALAATGTLVALLTPGVFADVSFEFRDPGNSPADADAHGVLVAPGDIFAFDLWAHATDGDHLLGLQFKLRFEEYGTGGLTTQTFTIVGEPEREPGPFTDTGGPTSRAGQRLMPENTDPLDPGQASDLGALVPDLGGPGVTGPGLFVARVTLAVDASMPEGIYHLSPFGDFYKWIDAASFDLMDFDQTTVYTVTIIPEPNVRALLGLAALAALGGRRRRPVHPASR